MKKWISFICICTLLVSLAACAPMNPVEKETAQTQQGGASHTDWKTEINELKKPNPADLPEHLTLEVSEYFQIDTDFAVSHELENYQVSELEIKQHLFDLDKDFDKLLHLAGNPVIKEKSSLVSDELLPDGSETKVEHARLDNDNFIQLRDGRFLICRYLDTVYSTIGVPSPYSGENSSEEDICGDVFKEGEELSFMPASDARQQIGELLEGMGIDHFPEMKSYACTQKELQEQVDQTIEYWQLTGRDQNEIDAMIQTVKPEDEGYCIVAEQGYQGIPYYSLGVGESVVNFSGMLGTQLDFLVTPQGILSGEAAGLYDFVEAKEAEDILSAGEILDTFITLHNDTTGKSRIKVTHTGLAYLPVLKDKKKMLFDAVPIYYVIYGQSNEGAESMRRNVNLFDARTGEQL